MDFRMTRSWIVIAVVSVAAGAIGCGGSGDNPAGPSQTTSSGGSEEDASREGPPPAGTGRLTVGIKDTPFSDAKAVLVTFKEVSVHRAEAGWETVAFAGGAAARTCDLKQLQAATDVLGVAALPAGHYTQIRLTVESAALYFENAAAAGPCAATIAAPAGTSAALKIPSGTVKLNRQFTVAVRRRDNDAARLRRRSFDQADRGRQRERQWEWQRRQRSGNGQLQHVAGHHRRQRPIGGQRSPAVETGGPLFERSRTYVLTDRQRQPRDTHGTVLHAALQGLHV